MVAIGAEPKRCLYNASLACSRGTIWGESLTDNAVTIRLLAMNAIRNKMKPGRYRGDWVAVVMVWCSGERHRDSCDVISGRWALSTRAALVSQLACGPLGPRLPQAAFAWSGDKENAKTWLRESRVVCSRERRKGGKASGTSQLWMIRKNVPVPFLDRGFLRPRPTILGFLQSRCEFCSCGSSGLSRPIRFPAVCKRRSDR